MGAVAHVLQVNPVIPVIPVAVIWALVGAVMLHCEYPNREMTKSRADDKSSLFICKML